MTNTSVQNHIHLSTTLGSGPENAPDLQWHIRAGSYRQIPRIYIVLDESLNGSLQRHVLTNGDGIVRKMDFKMQIVIAASESQTVWERLDDLISLYGQFAKFCPIKHGDNGQDHTNDIRNVVFSEIGEIPDFDPSLIRFYVDIQLADDSI